MKFFLFLISILFVVCGKTYADELPLEPSALIQLEAAPDVHPVLGDSLKLLGSPIQNKQTGEIIALACVGPALEGSNEPSCQTIQHIYIRSASQDAVLAGTAVQVSEKEPSSDEVRGAVQSLSRNFKDYHWNVRGRNTSTIAILGAGVGAFGSAVIVSNVVGYYVIVASAALTAATIGPFVLAVGAGLFILGRTHPLFSKNASFVTGLKNQNGWNWSSHSRKISNRKFNEYKAFLN
jgi:hypothetical protein